MVSYNSRCPLIFWGPIRPKVLPQINIDMRILDIGEPHHFDHQPGIELKDIFDYGPSNIIEPFRICPDRDYANLYRANQNDHPASDQSGYESDIQREIHQGDIVHVFPDEWREFIQDVFLFLGIYETLQRPSHIQPSKDMSQYIVKRPL